MYALLLSRSKHLPVIVVKGGDATPYMMACQACLSRPPGCGTFTCCARNHRMPNPDGTWRTIPCDKEALGPVMWTMLSSLMQYALGDERLDEYRKWCALVPHIMQGLPMPAEAALYSSATVPDFLRIFRFKTSSDEEGKRGSGYSPLFLAATSGNVPVARALIDTHGADIHIATHRFDTTFGLDKGGAPLHGAMIVCPPQYADQMVRVLLAACADPNQGTKASMTPLHAGAAFHNLASVKALLKHAEGKLRIDAGFKSNNASPLSFAVYLSTTEMVATLIDAGADVTHVNDAGGTMLIGAVQNPAATPEMLELLCASNQTNVNQEYMPRTRKWYLILRLFECLCKSRFVSNTDLIMEMAHGRGGTALHFAAMNGHAHLVDWLLENGAHKSLNVHDKMGSTAIDVAHIFGPFPEAESRLGAGMLDDTLHTRYVLRQGNLLREQDAHASAPVGAAGALDEEFEPGRAPAGAHHVGQLQGNGGHGSSNNVGGDDANGDSVSVSGGGGEAGGGGVWSSVTDAIAKSFPSRRTSDASQVALGEGAPQTSDSLRLRAMLEAIVEAQTRTLAARLTADNAALRAELEAQTRTLTTDNMAMRNEITTISTQITGLRAGLNLSA